MQLLDCVQLELCTNNFGGTNDSWGYVKKKFQCHRVAGTGPAKLASLSRKLPQTARDCKFRRRVGRWQRSACEWPQSRNRARAAHTDERLGSTKRLFASSRRTTRKDRNGALILRGRQTAKPNAHNASSRIRNMRPDSRGRSHLEV
jgi:hypothetical protein